MPPAEPAAWYRRVALTANAGASSSGESKKGIGLDIALGKEVSKKLAFGLATGLDWLGNRPYQRIIPMTLEGRWLMGNPSRWQPYLHVSSGYGIAWKDAAASYRAIKGGLRVKAAIGLTRSLGAHHTLLADIGLLEQRSEAERDNFWWWGGPDNYIRESFKIHRWQLRIGWVF